MDAFTIKTGNPAERGLRGPALAFWYAIFAVAAGAANLLAQAGAMAILPPDAFAFTGLKTTSVVLTLSVLTGTAVGFIIKYALDKIWIFNDGYDSHIHELRKIVIYAFFSVFTTVIFWGSEALSLKLWGTSAAKYTGGALGLVVGNTIKYFLDRAYVFKSRAP